MTFTYFDALPVQVLQEILKFLSKRSLEDDWIVYVSSSDLLSICRLQNCLGEELRRACKTLVKARNTFVEARRKCIFDSVLDAVHATVENVSIQTQSPQMRTSLSWITTLNVCTRIVSLEISICMDLKSFSSIISTHGSGLRTLSIRLFGKSGFISAISKSCSSLEHLSLLDPNECCTSMWESLGERLLSLHLQIWRSDPEIGNLDDIEKYCRKLTSINVSLPWFCSKYDKVCKLYSSYKEQLVRANLGTMDKYLCEQVKKNCPNAKFSISGMKQVIERMNVLGSSLGCVEIESYINTDVEFLKQTSALCTEIEVLKYVQASRVDNDYLVALFSSTKSNLVKLDFKGYGIESHSIEIISSSTGNLREFSCTALLNSNLCFKRLAICNKSIQSVTINLKPRRHDYEDQSQVCSPIIGNIFNSFEECKQLRELKIVSSFPFKFERFHRGFQIPGVVSASRKLCSRRVYVEVFGIHYA